MRQGQDLKIKNYSQTTLFKDVCTKFPVDTFFIDFYVRQVMSYLYQKCKKWGVTDFVSEIKRVEGYIDVMQAWSTGVYSD